MPRTHGTNNDEVVKSSMMNEDDGTDDSRALLFHSTQKHGDVDPPTESTSLEDNDDDEIHESSKHMSPPMNVPTVMTTASSRNNSKLVAREAVRDDTANSSSTTTQEVPSQTTTRTTSTVTIKRNEAAEKLGLSMKRDEHKRLVISNITSSGVVAMQTFLKVGDIVLQIGTVDCCHDELVSVRDAVELVREQSLSAQGVTMVVDTSARRLRQNDTKQEIQRTNTVTIKRNDSVEKLGLSMKRDEHKRLIISNIDSSGVVAMQTFLRVGDIVLQIANVDCLDDLSVRDAVALVRDQSLSPQGVTLVVDTSARRQGQNDTKQEIQRTNTVTIKRNEAAEKLGLSMKRDEHKRLIISNITPNGVVAMQTFLKVGDVVLQIANIDCQDMSVRDAVALVRDQSLSPQGVTMVVVNTLRLPRQPQSRVCAAQGASPPSDKDEQRDNAVEKIEAGVDLLVGLFDFFVNR